MKYLTIGSVGKLVYDILLKNRGYRHYTDILLNTDILLHTDILLNTDILNG